MLLYCRYVFEKILIILEETMKKTKIICTMGPNTNDRNLIKDLALAGMDIARFNFSHGDHEEQAGRFALIKSVREELNIPIATLLDTKGPEIRTGAVKDDKKVTLVEGQKYTLTTRQKMLLQVILFLSMMVLSSLRLIRLKVQKLNVQ